MTSEKPEEPSPQPAEKPASAEPTGESPAAEKPAAEKPAAKPAPPAGEKPAEGPLEPGVYGQFLLEHGIPSKRLPDSCGVETVEIDPQQLEPAIKRLRNSPEVAMNFLVAVSGVDSPDTFDSVYHLWSYSGTGELVVKVRIPKAQVPVAKLPMVPSLAPFWEAANWHERESFDLVGIKYIGHPYLRRILNPWDWEGHPLRRDYKQIIDALNDKAPGSFR